jgi:hypothetical protein
VWLFVLSPALALYVSLNWDAWGILLMVASLLLFARDRDGWGAAVLAAAVWTKFFPIVFLPLLLLDRLHRRGWRAAGLLLADFSFASVAVNGPVLLLAPAGWWHFFGFNRTRGSELKLYTLFDAWQPSVPEINRWFLVLFAVGLLVVLGAQWGRPRGSWLPACCAMLAWFFFASKVYSPQYSLWIVVLLAVIGASPALAVAWSAVDLLYFVAVFARLGLLQYGDAQGWFLEHALEPARCCARGCCSWWPAGASSRRLGPIGPTASNDNSRCRRPCYGWRPKSCANVRLNTSAVSLRRGLRPPSRFFPERQERQPVRDQDQAIERERQRFHGRVRVLPEERPLVREGQQREKQERDGPPSARHEHEYARPEQDQVAVPGDGRGQERRRDQGPQPCVRVPPDLKAVKIIIPIASTRDAGTIHGRTATCS